MYYYEKGSVLHIPSTWSMMLTSWRPALWRKWQFT